MIGLAIDALAKEYGEQVLIGKIDVDANPILTSKFGVRNMPTILFLKEKEIIEKQVGATTKSILEEKLKELL